MQVVSSGRSRPSAVHAALAAALETISQEYLRSVVEKFSVPRHFTAEPEANRRAGEWVAEELRSFGLKPFCQGEFRNFVALPATDRRVTLVGAHYDSVPGSPGADDNASAVAAMLGCARCVSEHFPSAAVGFVAFNREEDGLLGSADFVRDYLPTSGLRVKEAHVLEMVGYCDPSPGSQKLPAELPIKVRDNGDFLGVIGNRHSNRVVGEVLRAARTYTPEFPVLGLKVYFGLEQRFPHLRRSDHDPFWHARIPALMWTDTSEFRNPHYHRETDTPETLDYHFLGQVTQGAGTG